MVDVMWREGKPETAQHVRNWLHAIWLQIRLGLPTYRVSRVQADPLYFEGYEHDAFAIASDCEE